MRFLAEADFVLTRLDGAVFLVDAVEGGTVFAAGLGAGLELPVCAAVSSGENKRNTPQARSAAEMEEITSLCARIVY